MLAPQTFESEADEIKFSMKAHDLPEGDTWSVSILFMSTTLTSECTLNEGGGITSTQEEGMNRQGSGFRMLEWDYRSLGFCRMA